MNLRCSAVQVAVSVWSPQGDDLPDDIVRHLDDCAGCRSAFDARFVPLQPSRPVASPARRGPSRALPLVAVAALGLLFLPLGAVGPQPVAVAWASPAESPLTAEEQLAAPECPQAHDLDDPVCEEPASEWL